MKSKSIGFYFQGILAGILLFLFAAPFYVWEHQTLVYFLRIIYGVILVLNYKNEKDPLFVWIFLLVFISIAVGNSLISTLILIVSNVFLISTNIDFLRITYKSLYCVFVLFAILSILNYALFVLGVPMPSRFIDPLNEIKTYNYIAYPFMVVGNDVVAFFRFEGVFDEPGALATYCFLFLWAEKFDLYKWSNIVLIVAGGLTLSLFFFIATVMVMLIKTFSKGTSMWFRLLSLILIALFAYSMSIDDSIISQAIGDRLEYDEEKGFKGNNRSTTTLDFYYEQVRWKDASFFWGPTLSGADKNKVASYLESAAGYKRAILEVGLIGCIIYILFFFLYANKRIKNKAGFFLFILCFIMTLYQRPFFTDVVYIFMFVSIIKLYNYQSEEIEVGKSSKKLRKRKEQAGTQLIPTAEPIH